MYYESVYPPMLGGVSQQEAHLRLDGQVTEQINMLSDAVRGVCRRPGSTKVATISTPADKQFVLLNIQAEVYLLAFATGSADLTCINARTGAEVMVAALPTGVGAYIDACVASGQPFKACSFGSYAVVTNAGVLPTLQHTPPSPLNRTQPYAGYIYIPSGAYNTQYNVQVDLGGSVSLVSFTTPNGTSSAHIAASTPVAIATELADLLTADLAGDVDVIRDGQYIYLQGTSPAVTFSITSDTDIIHLQHSRSSYVQSTNVLPARLPVEADGFITKVGTGNLYYQYSAAAGAWLESARYNHIDYIKNLGLECSIVAGSLSIQFINSNPRAAGDTDSNPTLAILNGVTGCAAYQGRLVLLADQFVCMSAVNNPRAWFRSTMETLADSDPIEVAVSSIFRAPYTDAVLYNGDLLLIADSHQARILGGTVITPKAASMSVVGNFEVVSKVAPGISGGSLVLSGSTVKGYGAVLEMYPSNFEDGRLLSTNTTAHIPTYLVGDIKYSTISPSAETLVLGSGSNVLYVHQFMWVGSEKAQSAWHKWVFEWSILHSYFLEDVLYIVHKTETGVLMLCAVELQRGITPVHYLDAAVPANVQLIPGNPDDLSMLVRPGAPIGGGIPIETNHPPSDVTRPLSIYSPEYKVGEVVQDDFYVSASYTDGVGVYVGFPFVSSITPTPPIPRDRWKQVMLNAPTSLRGYKISVKDTGSAYVHVRDKVYSSGEYSAPIVPISTLGSGAAPLVLSGVISVPARTEARDTLLTISTQDYYDLHLIGLEYSAKINTKYRRM